MEAKTIILLVKIHSLPCTGPPHSSMNFGFPVNGISHCELMKDKNKTNSHTMIPTIKSYIRKFFHVEQRACQNQSPTNQIRNKGLNFLSNIK